MKRILFATIGSLGDLHPCLALGRELARRGHRVTIASTGFYRAKVEALGLGFLPLRPDWNPSDRDLIAQCADLKSGPEVLIRRIVLPHLRDTYDDLLAAARDADLMIAGELVYGAPLVSEKLGLPWASATLSPVSFLSAHDPSVLVNAPAMIHLRKLGWPVYRAVLNVGRLGMRHWWNPVRQLRREEGLRPDCDPLFRDKFSPNLVLALFSSLLARPQPDWPRQTVQPGFVFFDGRDSADDAPAELTAFLAVGDAPIVFTLGSTAVHNPGDFYDASAEAARLLGRRAVLLVGANPAPRASSKDILVLALCAVFARLSPRGRDCASGRLGNHRPGNACGQTDVIRSLRLGSAGQCRARVERLGMGLHVPRDPLLSHDRG